MTEVKIKDSGPVVMEDKRSDETPKPDKEAMDNVETTVESDSKLVSDSHSEKTEHILPNEDVGKCDVEKTSSVSDSVKESELARDDAAEAPEAETAAAACLSESVDEADRKEKVSSSEPVQEKVDVSTDQQASATLETGAMQQQTDSAFEDDVSKFTTEQISAQIVKQTTVSSFQESTISQTADSFTTTTEPDLRINASENLLDPDKISELRRSPYYDSLIANRISMESENMFSKTEEKHKLNGECPIATDGVHTAEELSPSGLDELEERVAKRVISLKEACQDAVNTSSQVTRSVTPNSVMFKVSKFEAKSFSEVRSSPDWSYKDSSLFKSDSPLLTSYQASDFSSSPVEQVQPTEEDMGVPPANEEVPFRFSPNAYKPPPEDEMDFVDLPRKKKMFSSSSFYEEPNAIYPTVEEQVELCRKIADSLSDDSNKKSKGANMFFKRVKRAEKWVVESIGTGYDSDYYESSGSESVSTPDPSKAPYVRVSKGPPQLKLILDPRHLVDMKRLRQEGYNIVEHNAVSPEICLDLVKDLNSPTGRGGQLFAKRKKKSEEWVVDEEKVKQLLRERESGYTSSPEPPAMIPCEPLVYPRVQMLKTPWAAAMESPIGSCAGAFKDLHPNEIAESVIRAAETKVMTYPAPVRPVIEPVIKPESTVQNYQSPVPFTAAPVLQQAAPKRPISTSSFKVGVYTADPYKPRAPKGWAGTSSGGSQFFSIQASLPAAQGPTVLQNMENPVLGQAPSMPGSKLTDQASLIRTYSFTNFNKSPRAWSETAYQNAHIKPVKPPSVLVQ